MISVSYGVYQMQFELDGQSVGYIREALGTTLNIDPRSIALINGERAQEHVTVNNGDRLEFVRLAGQKGSSK